MRPLSRPVLALALLLAAGPATAAAASHQPGAARSGTVAAAGPSCQAQTYRQDPDPAAIPWAQSRLGFQRVWPLTQGAGVTVAVVDSGVDPHPQLAGAVTDGGDLYLGSGTALADAAGHGTLVAGIIAARPAAGTGFTGVAPQAAILAVKVAEGECVTSADAIAAGIEAAIRHGASVVNVSITSETDSPALRQAVLDAQAHSVVVVAASGNDAASGNPTEYPAALPGVMAVAAVDADGKATVFSGSGEQIAVAAPGDGIVAPGARADRYGIVTGAAGTSFAAPYVAGVAALVRAAHPDLSASQVVRRIEATADRSGAARDPRLGWGVVDAYAAVTAVLPAERAPVATPSAERLTAPVVQARRPDRATGLSELVAAGAGGTAVLVAAAALAVPAARRRGWRAGTWRPEATVEPASAQQGAAQRSSV
jgi:type VII secretion-associated serine protease mycosin